MFSEPFFHWAIKTWYCVEKGLQINTETLLCSIDLAFTKKSRVLMNLGGKPLEYIVGKGENAGNQHFLLFPPCFLHDQRQNHHLTLNLICQFWTANNNMMSKMWINVGTDI